MTQSVPLSLVAAIGSAGFFAGSTALQYTAINTIEKSIEAIKDRKWLAGIVCNVFAIALQSLALSVGPLGTVQVTLLVGIVFVFPISALLGNRKLQISDLFWSIGLVIILSIFLTFASITGGITKFSHLALGVIYLTYFVTLAVALLFRKFVEHHASIALGTIAGSSYALAAALFQAFTNGATAPASRVLISLLLVATVAVGFIFNQLAFKQGAINGAITAISVSNPIVASAVGIAAFHERFGTSDATRVIASLSLLMLLVVSAKLSVNGASHAAH